MKLIAFCAALLSFGSLESPYASQSAIEAMATN